MKVAIINWAPIKYGLKEGGGVSIYSKNIADELVRRGCAVSTISIGYYYDLQGNVTIKSDMIEGIQYVDVINSPVVAPSILMFNAPIEVARSLDSDEMIRALLRSFGPFDVVHIQNVEGFSFSALEIIKEILPKAKLILSCHNYHVICQQANLWAQDTRRCMDFNRGSECVACNRVHIPVLKILAKRWTSRFPQFFQKVFRSQLRSIFKWNAKFRRFRFVNWANPLPGNRPSAGDFVWRRAQALKYVNEFCDHVICVSETVRDIMMRHGIVQDKLACCYIGTAHFDPVRMRTRAANNLRKNGEITIVFLGYIRVPHKGFDFLLEAFEQMPETLAGKINLKIAARAGDRAAVDRLRRLNTKFKSLDIRDGYLQCELEEILDEYVDVGLVTPMWDKTPYRRWQLNLCAMAFLFSSVIGEGKRNWLQILRFIFDGSSITDFWEKLSAIYNEPSLIGEFWHAERPLRTNAAHVDELMHFYRQN